MKKQNSDTMNYDVLNTLYLVDEELGKRFEESGKNPLGNNFVLSKDFVKELLSSARESRKDNQIELPDYLERGNVEVASNLKKIKNVIKELSEEIETSTLLEVELAEQINFYLKILNEMLSVATMELANENADSLQIYLRVASSSPKLFRLLQNAYKKDFDKMLALQNIFNFARQNYRVVPLKITEEAVREPVRREESVRQPAKKEEAEKRIERSTAPTQAEPLAQKSVKTEEVKQEAVKSRPPEVSQKETHQPAKPSPEKEIKLNYDNLEIAGVEKEKPRKESAEFSSIDNVRPTKAEPVPRFRNDDMVR